MPSSNFGWNASSTNLFVEDMIRLTEEIQRLANRRHANPSELARTRAEISKLVNGGRNRLNSWVSPKELGSVFREAYRNGGTIALSPADSSWSAGARKRFAKNGLSALNDMEQWGNNRVVENYVLAEVSRVRKEIDRVETLLSSGSVRGRDRAALEIRLEKYRTELPKLQGEAAKYRTFGDEPEVLSRRRRGRAGQKRGTVAARRPADQYWDMLGKTAHTHMSNQGYLRGAKARGVEWVLVSDGNDCGWTSHRDSDKANGKIVRIEDVIPYAHPNCRRSFQELPDGPRGRKTKELIERITGIKDSRNVRQAVQQAAKYGAILGSGAAVGRALGQNPLVREIIRDVLADSQVVLGSRTTALLNQWVNGYDVNEAGVLRAKGQADNALSRAELRRTTIQGVESKIAEQALDGDDFTLVRIGLEEMRVLGLDKSTVSRVELVDKLTDYVDFTRDRFDLGSEMLRSVGAAAQDSHAMAAIWREHFVSRRSTWMGRASNVYSNAKKVNNIAQTAIKKNPARAEIEAIKTLARGLDALPWLRYSQGPFRFSVGMDSRARARLAEDIWTQLRGPEFRTRLSQSLPEYHPAQWRYYVPLKNKINARYIYKSLLPRISYIPNSFPVHSTLFMNNGRLVPIFKLYPPGLFGKLVSLETRMATEEFMDFLARARRVPGKDLPKWLKENARELGDDVISSIELFRNGPIRFAARWQGSAWEDLAIKFRPDNGVWNHTMSWNRTRGENREKILAGLREKLAKESRKLNYSELSYISLNTRERMLLGASSEKMRVRELRNAVKFLSDSDLRVKKSLVVLPRIGRGKDLMPYFSGSAEIPTKIIGGLALTRGSVAEAAQALGIELRIVMIHLRSVLRRYRYRMDHFFKKLASFKPGADKVYSAEELQDLFSRVVLEERDKAEQAGPLPLRTSALTHREISDRLRSTSWIDKDLVDKSPDLNRVLSEVVDYAEEAKGRYPSIKMPSVISESEARRLFGDIEVDNYLSTGVEAFWTFQGETGLGRRMLDVSKSRIVLPDHLVDQIDRASSVAGRARGMGWFTPRVFGDEVTNLIVHEFGHHMHSQLYMRFGEFWNQLFSDSRIRQYVGKDLTIPQSVLNEASSHVTKGDYGMAWSVLVQAANKKLTQPGLADLLRIHLSEYGTTNVNEFMAEMMAEVVQAKEPGLFATVAREILKRF